MEKEITPHLWLLLMFFEGLEFVQELGEHSDEESIGIVEELEVAEDENAACLQENYNSLVYKSGKYAHVAKAAVEESFNAS